MLLSKPSIIIAADAVAFLDFQTATNISTHKFYIGLSYTKSVSDRQIYVTIIKIAA